MKLTTSALCGALILLFAAVPVTWAADAVASVPATMTIGASTIFSLQAKNVSNHANAETIVFGPTPNSDGTIAAQQYIELGCGSNYANWRVRAYTQNRTTTDTQNANWGALIGSNPANRVPLLWQVHDTPVAGGPELSNDAIFVDGAWTWFKDTGDSDYVSAAGGGYTEVVVGLTPDIILKGQPGGMGSTPLAIYLGAYKNGAPAPDAYSTRLYFELIHL